jgi:hypothetical protein
MYVASNQVTDPSSIYTVGTHLIPQISRSMSFPDPTGIAITLPHTHTKKKEEERETPVT